MARLIALYKPPADTAAFDRYYFSTHVPLAKKLPGLRKYAVNSGPVMTPAGPSGYHLIAMLDFDSPAAMQAALGSPEGQAASADVAKFASGGADILIFDSKDV